jgi:O-antigen/teichoic acid export membrane protein
MTAPGSIRQGATWLLGGSMAGRAIQFLVGLVLARLLVPADFGLLVTIQVFTGLAGFFAGAGMGEALVQAREAGRREFDTVFTLYLGSCLSLYLAFFLAAPLLAHHFDEPRYQTLVRVTALSFLFRPFLAIPTVYLRRQMRFPLMAKLDLLNLVVASSASLFLAWQGFGVWALVFGGQAGTLVHVTALMRHSGWRPGFALDQAMARRLVGYGVKFTANDIAVYLRTEAVNLLVSARLGPAGVGLYNKADSLSRLPTEMVSGAVYQPLFRGLAAARDDLTRCQYLYLRAVTLILLYTLPVYFLLVLLGEPVITVLYGEAWRDAGRVLSILGLLGPLFVLENTAGAVSAAFDRLGRELGLQLAALVLCLTGAWLLSGHGIAGVAVGILPGCLLFTVSFLGLALRTLGLGYAALLAPASALARPTLALAVVALALTLGLPAGLARDAPALHCLLVALPSGMAYASVFLLFPAAAVADEATRWRRRLPGLRGAG